MSQVQVICLLVTTLLAKMNAQDPEMDQEQVPPNLHKSSNTNHLITQGFDKPSSIRLKIRSPHLSTRKTYEFHPIKGSCKHNIYNIFSKDHTSNELRNDYGIWNYGNYQEPQSNRQRLAKRNENNNEGRARYSKLIDRKENPYMMDDDYSLLNYVDDWNGVVRKVKRFQSSLPKSRKILKNPKHHEKRDVEDKEFQVEFWSSRKENEFKGNLRNDVSNECNHRRMFKSGYRPKKQRNYYLDGVDQYKSRAKFISNKKHTLWGRKRGKTYPKLGANSGFLDELEERPRSMAGKGKHWHWATTRDYVGAMMQREGFVSPRNPAIGMIPRVLIPVMNPSGALISQSFTAKPNAPQSQPVELQSAAFKLPLRMVQNGLPFGNIGFRPVVSRHMAASRSPPIFFNPSTEIIHEEFKNTPFWNPRASPPKFGGFISNPVGLAHAGRTSTATPTMFGTNVEKLKNGSSLNHKGSQQIRNSSQGTTSAKQKALEPADIVNLLQNAFVPQNTTAIGRYLTSTERTQTGLLQQNLPIDKVLELISPPGSTRKQIDSVSAGASDKLMVDATKQALLSLFTTEVPMMESLEDILRRNTNRKIPIVYDIEDAPQLALQNSKNNSDEEEPLTATHILDRRGILKKNKTAIKSKIIAKAGSTNNTIISTPWIVIATTENMLYLEIKAMERRKLNGTRKSKTLKSAARRKINLRFKTKSRSNETTDEIRQQEQPSETQPAAQAQATEGPKVKNKRDVKAATLRRKHVSEPVSYEPRCGRKCACYCHPTTATTKCCRCKQRPPLELTTKLSCQPANLSKGSISCPDCHQEFTYKLGLSLVDA